MSKKRLLEEKILKSMASTGAETSAEQRHLDHITTSKEEFDDLVVYALEDRLAERFQKGGYGKVEHPTALAFKIGIDSIRQGKASETFLSLLDLIAKRAVEHDVLALVFPEDFPRKIKGTSLNAAQRDVELVEDFKTYVRQYLSRPRAFLLPDHEDEDGKLGRSAYTYAEVMAEYKAVKSPDECKAIDRAIAKYGQDIVESRIWIEQIRRDDL